MNRWRAAWLALALLLAPVLAQAKLLVPMDDAQANHLKAYGLTFWVLQKGLKCEWLLNYRGGSFLLPEDASIEREVPSTPSPTTSRILPRYRSRIPPARQPGNGPPSILERGNRPGRR